MTIRPPMTAPKPSSGSPVFPSTEYLTRPVHDNNGCRGYEEGDEDETVMIAIRVDAPVRRQKSDTRVGNRGPRQKFGPDRVYGHRIELRIPGGNSQGIKLDLPEVAKHHSQR